MGTPSQAIDYLVDRVENAAQSTDPLVLRRTLVSALSDLRVNESDPAWSDGRDVIGAAYERLLAGHQRRARGQFFTPLPVARVMAHWALADDPDLLLEPGMGSGSMLIAASQERSAATRLVGLDIDPVAISMAQANCDIRRIDDFELRQADFLIDRLEERPAAVLCNPPYTRHQLLDPSTKASIFDGFEKRLGVRFSHLASLHVLFLLRALEVSAADARLAFITPAHWLDMGYATKIKELLLDMAHIEAIVNFPTDQPVFEHAITTAAITLIRKGVDTRQPTRLHRTAGPSAAELQAELADPDRGIAVTLKSKRKWSRVGTSAVPIAKLKDYAAVKRGIATGFNSYFVLSEDQREALGLGRSSMLSCAASPRLFSGNLLDRTVFDALPSSAPRWLFRPQRVPRVGPIAEYLAHGEYTLDVRSRHLVKQRERAGRPWYQIRCGLKAPILFTYFNRGKARFVRNSAEAVPLNTWLVIEPLPNVDPDDLFALLCHHDTQKRLRDDCRVYGNGLWKLEPSELAGIALPRAPKAVEAGCALVSAS
jgi:adenine-specific DNA-methyltransferase